MYRYDSHETLKVYGYEPPYFSLANFVLEYILTILVTYKLRNYHTSTDTPPMQHEIFMTMNVSNFQ